MIKFKHKTTGLEIFIDQAALYEYDTAIVSNLESIGFEHIQYSPYITYMNKYTKQWYTQQTTKYPKHPYIKLEQGALDGECVTYIRYGTDIDDKFKCDGVPFTTGFTYDKNFGTLTLTDGEGTEAKYIWNGMKGGVNPWSLMGGKI